MKNFADHTNNIIAPLPDKFSGKINKWIRVQLVMKRYGVCREIAEIIIDYLDKIKGIIVY